jgi:hypothetical protein
MTTPIINLAAVWLTTLLTGLAPAPMDGLSDPEDPAARTRRIAEIGADIAGVVYDPAERPIFMGPNARAQTAAVVATFAVEEGMNLAPSIDSGRRRGDNGRSWCIMQLNVGRGKTPEGWTGPDLIADRKKCIRAGLHALRRSYWACAKNPEQERFAAYASGSCGAGRSISSRRYDRAMRRLYMTPAPAEQARAARD